MAIGIGAQAALSGLGQIGGLLNAQNAWGTSQGTSEGQSWGSSAENAYSNSWSWSKENAKSISDSYGWGTSDSQSWSQSQDYSRTFGREASAQDIYNASQANQIQKDLWSMQADYNAKQAAIDREFQATMSNTAYQRAVIDLLSAGLNPILAVGNMGASTPAGAMATSGLAQAYKANAYAESESYGSSSARSVSRSEERSGSHSESSSSGKSKSGSDSRSSGYSSSGSTNSSQNSSVSKTETQLKDLVGAVAGLVSGSSAKNSTSKPGVKQWNQATTPAKKK